MKTGQTVLLNARIAQRGHDRFHDIVEAERLRYEAGELTHRVTLGEVVERALAALEREIGRGRVDKPTVLISRSRQRAASALPP